MNRPLTGPPGSSRPVFDPVHPGAALDAPRAGLPWVLPRLARGLGIGVAPRALLEALPHAVDVNDKAAVIAALRRLGATARIWRRPLHELPASLLPALLVAQDGRLAVLAGRTEQRFLVERAGDGLAERVAIDALKGEVHVFAGRDEAPQARTRPLLRAILSENGWAIAGVVVLAALGSIASIALGLIVMMVFDLVIPSGDPAVVLLLALGFGIALAADVGARFLVALGAARIGGRAERRVLSTVFDKVVRLPWMQVATQDHDGQVARMREVEAARELFTGPLPQALLHLPSVLLFLIAILALAGPLVLVPLAVLPLQLLAASLLSPRARDAEAVAGSLSGERRRMMFETVTHGFTLRAFGMDRAWTQRFRDLSAGAVARQAEAGRAAQAMQIVVQLGLPLAVAGIATLGAVLVVQQAITAGALVAAIMLSWRVLTPMQSFVLVFGRFGQIADAMAQLHRLQLLREEARPPEDAPQPKPAGHSLRFERVVFRHAPGADPAIAGISLRIPEGARVAITGPSGSGKSTLLRLAMGLVAPQGGTITLGGVNLAQFDGAVLRGRIGYVPQNPGLIYGTIAQNLRLSVPGASDAELASACARAGFLSEIEALPDGFATPLDDLTKERMPQGLRHGVALAQALLRRPQVLLLDDTVRMLDEAREERFVRLLDEIHGTTSVLLVTHRPSLMRRADLVVELDRGTIVSMRPPNAPKPGAQPALAAPPQGPGR